MDQRALGALAEQAAHLAQQGDPARLTELVRLAAAEHHVAEWTMTSLIAKEWDRQGIARVPRFTRLRSA